MPREKLEERNLVDDLTAWLDDRESKFPVSNNIAKEFWGSANQLPPFAYKNLTAAEICLAIENSTAEY